MVAYGGEGAGSGFAALGGDSSSDDEDGGGGGYGVAAAGGVCVSRHWTHV